MATPGARPLHQPPLRKRWPRPPRLSRRARRRTALYAFALAKGVCNVLRDQLPQRWPIPAAHPCAAGKRRTNGAPL